MMSFLNFLDCVLFIYIKRRDFYIYRERERERERESTESENSAKERRETDSMLFWGGLL